MLPVASGLIISIQLLARKPTTEALFSEAEG